MARELCTYRKHAGRDEGGARCRECGRTYPCATVTQARRAASGPDPTPQAGLLMVMGGSGSGKTDGAVLEAAERAAIEDEAPQEQFADAVLRTMAAADKPDLPE